MVKKTVYLDEQHNEVKPEKAVFIIVTEYDKDGRVTSEKWGKPKTNPTRRGSEGDSEDTNS